MPQPIHEVSKNLIGKTPIGELLPNQFERLAYIEECTIYEQEPPISHRFTSIHQEYNRVHGQQLSEGDVINASRQWERKYLRWQAIRHIGKGYKLTGHEPFYLGEELFGMVDDTDAIALTISLRGLELQNKHKRITNRLLTVGLDGLSISELRDVNDILGKEIGAQQQRMTDRLENRRGNWPAGTRLYQPGIDFRDEVLKVIDSLPAALRTIYYFKGDREQIQSVYALPDGVPDLGPLKKTNWQRVMQIAEANRVDYSLDRLKQGRDIIKSFSQGIDPLTRVFMSQP